MHLPPESPALHAGIEGSPCLLLSTGVALAHAGELPGTGAATRCCWFLLSFAVAVRLRLSNGFLARMAIPPSTALWLCSAVSRALRSVAAASRWFLPWMLAELAVVDSVDERSGGGEIAPESRT